MATYRIWENRIGQWHVSEQPSHGATVPRSGTFDHESGAFEEVKRREGGDELKAASSTSAQPWHDACPACNKTTFRVRRRLAGVFRHCLLGLSPRGTGVVVTSVLQAFFQLTIDSTFEVLT